MAKITRQAIVAKDHGMVDKLAGFKLQELRLIAFCLAHYDSRKPDNPEFKSSIQDLLDIFPGMDENSAYDVVRAAMIGINKKPLEFKEGNKRHFWNWFRGFTYYEGEGVFEFRINPDLHPYLLELKGTFTRFRLLEVYQFKSATTWKLYEHLKKCWSFSKIWAVSLDELKIKLGIPLKYPRWADFRNVVIDPAITEINRNSDIFVTYEKKKHVRTVAGLIFTVNQRQPDGVISIEGQYEKILKLLLENGIHDKTARDYTKKIEDSGRSSDLINKIPNIRKRWVTGKPKDLKTGKEIPLSQYLLAAINDELRPQDLPFERSDKSLHSEAQKCWQTCKGTCGVFQYGTPLQPACEYCPGRSNKTSTLDSRTQKS